MIASVIFDSFPDDAVEMQTLKLDFFHVSRTCKVLGVLTESRLLSL